MVRNIIILILLFVFRFGFSQSKLVIPLNTIQKNARFSAMTVLWEKGDINYDSLIVYKGIPSTVSSYIIKTLDFQPQQGVYELFLRLQGKMPKEVLAQGLKGYGFEPEDTIKLSKTSIKHFVSFLVGKNDIGETIIIGDSNNNYDFSDDEVNSWSPDSNNYKRSEVKKANFFYQYAYNGKVIDDSVFLGMSPKSSSIRYINPIEQEFFLTISLEEYKSGLLKTSDTSFNVKIAFSKFPQAFYEKSNTRIFFGEDKWNEYYLIGDSISLGEKKLFIDAISCTGDTLYLSVLKNGDLFYGVYPGSYAYAIASNDFVNNRPFGLDKYKGKYVLLDFWGSWCEPCLKGIPDLVKYSKKYKDKLQIVSVAEEAEDRKNVLKAIIKNKGMKWIHLFEKLNDTTKRSIAYKYKVESYPTQILIDPEGKIIYRSTLDAKLTEDKLNSLLK